MKSILATAVSLVAALGLLTGCTRQPPELAPAKNIEDAKRRNEALRQLEQRRKESVRHQEISEGGRRVQKLRDARSQAKIEREKFNGKWVATALTFDGTEVSTAELKEGPWYWVVNAAKVLSRRPGSDGKTIHEEEIVIAIDPSRSPMTIDLTHQAKKETNKGIYEFEGGILKICFAMNPTGARPGDFTAKKDSKRALMVWKRVNE
jgi:uncharacterized protein (TIGR03067 family)